MFMKRIHYWYVRCIAQLIWWNERLLFYPPLRRFYRKVFTQQGERPVILDVGANRGQSIRFFRTIFSPSLIHAFEPNNRLVALLTRRYSTPDVIIHPMGMSDSAGELLFHENILDETSSFEAVQSDSLYLKTKGRVLLVDEKHLTTRSYPVPVTTIDIFLQEAGIGEVAILKVDVEGHEKSVLHGAAKSLAAQKIRFIQLEEHADDQYGSEHDYSHWLRSLGYREVWRLKHGFGNFFEVLYERTGATAISANPS
jgi:FkbM family methyltransferase